MGQGLRWGQRGGVEKGSVLCLAACTETPFKEALRTLCGDHMQRHPTHQGVPSQKAASQPASQPARHLLPESGGCSPRRLPGAPWPGGSSAGVGGLAQPLVGCRPSLSRARWHACGDHEAEASTSLRGEHKPGWRSQGARAGLLLSRGSAPYLSTGIE